MSVVSLLREVGNRGYKYAFPVYSLCYRAFKACTDRAERQLMKSILSEGELSWWTRVRISVFIRSFSPTVLVQPVLFIHSNLRPTILNDCVLLHVSFEMYA
jgi:hypothetical protein